MAIRKTISTKKIAHFSPIIWDFLGSWPNYKSRNKFAQVNATIQQKSTEPLTSAVLSHLTSPDMCNLHFYRTWVWSSPGLVTHWLVWFPNPVAADFFKSDGDPAYSRTDSFTHSKSQSHQQLLRLDFSDSGWWICLLKSSRVVDVIVDFELSIE